MNKKDYVDFFKNYILGTLGLIIYIPKYIFVIVLLSIPFYILPISFFYLLSLDSLSLLNLDTYIHFLSNFSMKELSFFDQIGFLGIGLTSLLLVFKIFPNILNSNDHE